MKPEAEAREKIDGLLALCGWAVQDYGRADLSAGRGVALREVLLKSGRCDYLLIVDRVPVGIIEAKKEGSTLSGVATLTGVEATLAFNVRTSSCFALTLSGTIHSSVAGLLFGVLPVSSDGEFSCEQR